MCHRKIFEEHYLHANTYIHTHTNIFIQVWLNGQRLSTVHCMYCSFISIRGGLLPLLKHTIHHKENDSDHIICCHQRILCILRVVYLCVQPTPKWPIIIGHLASRIFFSNPHKNRSIKFRRKGNTHVWCGVCVGCRGWYVAYSPHSFFLFSLI